MSKSLDRKSKVESGESFPYNYNEKCIVCGGSNYGDIHIVKIPELVGFCLKCAEKNNDENTKGWGIHRIGEGLLSTEGDEEAEV